MELNSLRGYFHGNLCRKQLRHGSFHRINLLRILGESSTIDEKLRSFNLRLHVSQLELRILELGNRTAELLSFLDVFHRLLESAFGNAESLSGNADTAAVERVHGNLEALALFAEQILLRNDAVLENQLSRGGTADAHLLFLGADAEAREILLHNESGDSARTLGLVGHGKNDVGVSLAAVRDEDLAAVEDIVVALQNSLRLLAGSIRARVRLSQAERAQLFALGERNQIFLDLLRRAVHLNRVGTQGRVSRNDNARGGTNLRQLLHAENIRERIAALAAILLRLRNAQEAQLCHLFYCFSRKTLQLVNFLCQGLDFIFREIVEKSASHFLFFRKHEIHNSSILQYSKIAGPGITFCNRRSLRPSCGPAYRHGPSF